jgi:hypothetical protein
MRQHRNQKASAEARLQKRHHLLDCGRHAARALGHEAAARSDKRFLHTVHSIRQRHGRVDAAHRTRSTTDSIDRNWDINCWGIGDFYGHEYRGDRDDFRTVYGYVEKDLTGNRSYEVMVIPG